MCVCRVDVCCTASTGKLSLCIDSGVSGCSGGWGRKVHQQDSDFCLLWLPLQTALHRPPPLQHGTCQWDTSVCCGAVPERPFVEVRCRSCSCCSSSCSAASVCVYVTKKLTMTAAVLRDLTLLEKGTAVARRTILKPTAPHFFVHRCKATPCVRPSSAV